MSSTKCYKSLSCLLSVGVILFILGAIITDVFYTKPEMRNSINEIRVEVKDIHRKIDIQSDIIQNNKLLMTVQAMENDSTMYITEEMIE